MQAEAFSSRPLSLLLAGLAGLAQAVSIAVPGSGQPLWWLQLLALGLLAGLLAGSAHWRRAAMLGWVFACAWLAGTFWWLFISLHTYGGLPAPLAVFSVLALAGVLALYYAAACAVFALLAPGLRAARAPLFAALWLLAELARSRWFTGFGWGAGGYAHVEGPLAGYAPWVGVFGIGAIAAWLAMAAPQAWRGGWGLRATVLSVLLLPTFYQATGPVYSSPAGRVQVALLQGNIPQDEKFQSGSGVPLALQWYGEQLRDSTAPLVVTPETAIPLLPQQLPEGYWGAIRQRFASGAQAALIGLPLGDPRAGYTNAVLGLMPGQTAPWRYDKHHLVPFGEFIPPFFKWFTAMMNIPLGDFRRGGVGQPSFEWQGQRLAANICYEDLFGEELAARFADPARAPTVFVNFSNIAWFGDSVAIDQHLNISRLRALEFSRPFARATNTGATAFIDHQGRVTSALARHTRGVLTSEVEGRTGITPYAGWVSRFGLWPLWLGALGLVLWAGWRRRLTARAALSRG